jgi:hypothetical protein
MKKKKIKNEQKKKRALFYSLLIFAGSKMKAAIVGGP